MTLTVYDKDIIDEVRDWLAKVTYKPGWRFVVVDPRDTPQPWPDDPHYLQIEIRYSTEDSGSPGHTVDLRRSFGLPLMLFRSNSFHLNESWLRDCLCKMECHEVDEWLRISDKRITDPHPTGAR